MRDGDHEHLKQAAASGVRCSAVSSAATIAVSFVNTAVLGRLLGPEAFGLFAMVMVYMGFATTIADLGLSEALIQRQAPTPQALASLYWLNLALGGVLYAVSLLCAPWVASGFGHSELVPLIRVGALAVPIGTAASQYAVLANKELRFRFVATVQVARAVLGLAVALVAAALFHQGVWSFVWGVLSGSLLASISFLTYGTRWFGWPRLHFAWRDLRGYLRFGAYGLGTNALNYANTNADQVLVGALFGARVLGYYRMAINLVFQPILRLNPMVTQVAFPVFSKIQDDIPRIRAGFLRVIRLLTLIDAPILIGFALVAPAAVPLVMGEPWLPAVPLIQVLALYALIRAVPSASGGVILAKGRADWTFHWNLALFALIPLTIYLAAIAGEILGVAWALVGLQVVLLGFHYWVFLRSLLGGFLPGYVKAFGLPLLLAAGMGACVLGARAMLPEATSLLGLGAEVVTGAVAYCGLVWLFMRKDVTETLRLAVGRK